MFVIKSGLYYNSWTKKYNNNYTVFTVTARTHAQLQHTITTRIVMVYDVFSQHEALASMAVSVLFKTI